ncbi:MAG TPA: hypothetical protein PKA13_17850 [Geminicoccaceae bacterium]|nr:hypothetical protein [Geminicoccus sp.]HMU51644.1 hypothetical protein [Geminicoccaceae bacterium]
MRSRDFRSELERWPLLPLGEDAPDSSGALQDMPDGVEIAIVGADAGRAGLAGSASMRVMWSSPAKM